jgi:hypothetical protein
MQLLETVSQDIKSARDYKPCAPEFFRVVVLSAYGLVLLSLVAWGLFVLREKQQNTLADKDQKRLTELNEKIASVHEQGAKSQMLKRRYDTWQGWLKGNYNLSSFLAQLYKVLPEGTRLQELTLKEEGRRQGAFTMKMRFFSLGENRVPDTQDFEDKLTAMGVELQERQQSVSEGGKTQIDATMVLPRDYFPGGKSRMMHNPVLLAAAVNPNPDGAPLTQAAAPTAHTMGERTLSPRPMLRQLKPAGAIPSKGEGAK